MNLSELIFKRLSSDEVLADKLATFSDLPAIFDTEFPNDQMPGWGDRQYPRISYHINLQANTERLSAGTIRIGAFALKDPSVTTELEEAIKKRLKDVLLQSDDGAPLCLAWARSEPYIIQGTAIHCTEMVFDLLEFNEQYTTDPDPAEALNNYLKEKIPDALIVGMDNIENMYEPSDECPAFFVRINTYKQDHATYAVIWNDCDISIHIIAPSVEARNIWCRKLQTLISRTTRVTMSDDSPMIIRGVSANNRADYLTIGQIKVNTLYSMLSGRVKKAEPLNHIVVRME